MKHREVPRQEAGEVSKPPNNDPLQDSCPLISTPRNPKETVSSSLLRQLHEMRPLRKPGPNQTWSPVPCPMGITATWSLPVTTPGLRASYPIPETDR